MLPPTWGLLSCWTCTMRCECRSCPECRSWSGKTVCLITPAVGASDTCRHSDACVTCSWACRGRLCSTCSCRDCAHNRTEGRRRHLLLSLTGSTRRCYNPRPNKKIILICLKPADEVRETLCCLQPTAPDNCGCPALQTTSTQQT
jgi:hypothetical protein